MSGAQTSSFPDQNILYNNASGLTTAHVLQNQLANQGAQRALNADEMEQLSRASNWVISQDPDNKDPAKQAAAYSTAVGILQKNGYAKNAPSAYPGFDHMQLFARMGTPSKDLYQQTQDSAWANANRIGGGGGGAGAVAPPGAGGGSAAPSQLAIPSRGAGGPGATAQLPPQYLQYFREASAETGIPMDLLIAQARQESTFNPDAKGAAGEVGMFQIKPSTAQSPGFGLTGVDPASLTGNSPEAVRNNILFGARYLRARMGQGNPNDPAAQAAALAAYNGGGDPNYVANVSRYRPGFSPSDPAARVTTYAAAPPAAAPGGGVVARNPGAVQVAGPGAGPAPAAAPGAAATPPAPVTTADPETGLPVLSAPPNQVMPGQPNGPPRPLTASEQATIEAQRTGKPVPVSDRPGFWATPDGTLTTAPGREATAAPPPPAAPAVAAPAATAPAATAPPAAAINLPPIPPPPVTNDRGLTAAETKMMNDLLPSASRSATGKLAWDAQVQRMADHNRDEQQQYATAVAARQDKVAAAQHQALEEQRGREADARAAVTQQREEAAAAALAEQRRVENKRQQEAADRDAQRLAQGSTQADKDTYTLTHDNPSTQNYAEAWSRKKWETAPNGNVIERDVSEYPAPTRSIQRPSFLPSPTPQGLDEARKADVDAKVITSAIDHYTDVFEAVGGGGWDAYFANPKDPKTQQLLGAFDRMKTVLRSPQYYNTGVLQPAEIKLMGEDLVSPQSLRGVFATPQALATRLGEIKLAVLTRQDAELRSVGRPGVIVRDKADFAQVPIGGRYYDEEGHLHVRKD